ncbi:MAG TPA: 30S ribosomal protein S7, partial [Balneola sp.]|nr:30S ribosomal protein S7 [Balneola sp.]
PIFEDKLITRFVNNLMRDGKKNVARKIVYQAFEIIEEKTGETGIDIFKSAMQNATPVVEVKSRRVGGATYQVPMEVRQERGTALGMRWLIRSARSR